MCYFILFYFFLLLAHYKTELYFLKVPMATWWCDFYQNNVWDSTSSTPLRNHKFCNVVMAPPPRPFGIYEKAPQFQKQTLPVKYRSQWEKSPCYVKCAGEYLPDGLDYHFTQSTDFGKECSLISFTVN